MAAYFDPSPRSSKRRKTTNYTAGPETKSQAPSVLRNISNAMNASLWRLFNGKDLDQNQDQDEDREDSTYGSKEDSFEEDTIIVGQATTGYLRSDSQLGESDDELASEEVVGTPGRSTRSIKMSRASGSLVFASEAHEATGRATPTRKGTLKRKQSNLSNIPDRADPGARRKRVTSSGQPHLDPSQSQGGLEGSKQSGSKKAYVNMTNEEVVTRPKRRSGRMAEDQDTDVTTADTMEAESDADENSVDVQPRSSGRESRKPKKYLLDLKSPKKAKPKDRPLANSPPPKSILTPSKKGRTPSRKSVVFQEDEKQMEEHLGFRDIDTLTKKKTDRRKMHVEAPSKPVSPVAQNAEHVVTTPPVEWVAEAELPHTEEDIQPQLFALQQPDKVIAVELLTDETDEDPHLTEIKAAVIARLTSHGLQPLESLLPEYATIHSLISATITAGEGNSMLVLGSRGSGKTALIENAVAHLRAKHGSDFHVVRLNGFVQTDDRIALREIWRQLGREMNIPEEETNQASSYADTMASLLSLLSHPEELAETVDPDAPDKVARSVVFVLDEFDLFTTHPRQTLLYNLFDIAQARKAPIAVLGCSTRVDVMDCLEKRVKSRFSHRWVHLGSSRSMSAFEEVVRNSLCQEENSGNGRAIGETKREWNKRWNEYIKTSFLPSPEVQSLIQRVFHTTKSIPELFSALHIPVATISLPESPATAAANTTASTRCIIPTSTTAPPDSLLVLLSTLPTLHLALVIAAARLDAIHNIASVNFNIAYSHYVELAARVRLQNSAAGALAQGSGTKIWSRDVAMAAWEDLAGWELLVAGTKTDDGGGGGLDTKMWKVDVTLEEVAWAVQQSAGGGIADVLGKWCREV